MAAFIPGASPPDVRTAICFDFIAIIEGEITNYISENMGNV
tara:strand:- start:33 stop:155 length:123 start_codon:yes stop_codon:yes gene_type:complete